MRHSILFAFAAILALALAACGETPSSDKTPKDTKMQLTSSAFHDLQPIPKDHTGEGEDLSPPLTWADAPDGVQSFALICDDPDAPSRANPRDEPWVHWLIYNIPADTKSLPAGLAQAPRLDNPQGAIQAINSWGPGNHGYKGPMPPPGSGPHRYYFKLYALDTILAPLPRAGTGEQAKNALLDAMEGHILAETQLMGTYERK